MDINNIGKRIIIIGSPGSGKTFLSKKLNKKFKYPLYHLDDIYWKEDWVSIPDNVFQSKILDILKKDEFIIDGNYGDSIYLRAEKADTIIIMKTPLYLCLFRILKRTIQNKLYNGKHLPQKIRIANKFKKQKSNENTFLFLIYTIKYNIFYKEKILANLVSDHSEKIIQIKR